MKIISIYLSFVLSIVVISGCAPAVYHSYAYDDQTLAVDKVGVLLGNYGNPALLVTAVDDRKFSISFSQPHPVKIFVLPGKRVVEVEYIGSSLSTRYSAKGKLEVLVEPGHTYKLQAARFKESVEFSVKDLGIGYDPGAYNRIVY